MFERTHHQRIALVLEALNAPLLRELGCLFGGGTAMALRFGEYRESVDIDFLVSNRDHYRRLRHLLTGIDGIRPILREGTTFVEQLREIRADQYGIRTQLSVLNHPIKFEIVLEGRIDLASPAKADEICGVTTLTPLDMAASKLLANSDRWADDGVFSRDVIDLAMMQPGLPLLRLARAKAEGAYGPAVCRDLDKAIDKLHHRGGWLERCMRVMGMTHTKATVWQHIRALRRVLPTPPASPPPKV